MSEEEIKQGAYENFRRFVHERMRTDTNSNIRAREYGRNPPAGADKLLIVIEHVTEGNEEMFRQVREYKTGSKLVIKRTPTGEVEYVAYVPFRSLAPKSTDSKKHKHRHEETSRTPPSPYELMGYLMGVAAVCIYTAAKTTTADWAFLW